MSAGAGRRSDPKGEAADAIARAQAELERAVDELSRLPAVDLHSIALAAHALNNFLTVSGGVVAHLIPALRGHPDRQISVWLEGLAHATDLMSHTVSQLMNNSAGIAVTLRLEEFDLSRLVERTCLYYRRAAAHKGITLMFQAGDALPAIETDRVLVAAVLDNLLSNAVKYSPRESRIHVSVAVERDGIVCRVQDEGPGLSDTANLFVPFFTTKPNGTGIGLALSRQIAEAHGGVLTLENRDDRPGVRARLRLPLR